MTCNSVKDEIKFHLECQLHFPSAQLMLRQMHLTNICETLNKRGYRLSTFLLNSRSHSNALLAQELICSCISAIGLENPCMPGSRNAARGQVWAWSYLSVGGSPPWLGFLRVVEPLDSHHHVCATALPQALDPAHVRQAVVLGGVRQEHCAVANLFWDTELAISKTSGELGSNQYRNGAWDRLEGQDSRESSRGSSIAV